MFYLHTNRYLMYVCCNFFAIAVWLFISSSFVIFRKFVIIIRCYIRIFIIISCNINMFSQVARLTEETVRIERVVGDMLKPLRQVIKYDLFISIFIMTLIYTFIYAFTSSWYSITWNIITKNIVTLHYGYWIYQ